MKRFLCVTICLLLLLSGAAMFAGAEGEGGEEGQLTDIGNAVTDAPDVTEAPVVTDTPTAGTEDSDTGERTIPLASGYEIKIIQDRLPVARTSMIGNSTGFLLEVTKNGEKVPGTSLDLVSFTASAGPNHPEIQFTTAISTDGNVYVRPYWISNSKVANTLLGWLGTYRLSEKKIPVTITVTGFQSVTNIDATLQIVNESTKRMLFNWIVPWFLLFVLIGYSLKPRFNHRCKIYYVQGKIASDNVFKTTGYLSRTRPGKTFGMNYKPTRWTFIPFVANRITLHHIRFVAYAPSFFQSKKVRVRRSSLKDSAVLLDTIGLDPHRLSKIDEKRLSAIPKDVKYITLDKTHGILCSHGKYVYAYFINFQH